MIDFLVPADWWGVELTRDGTDLAEHYARFEHEGRYAGWIANGQVQDWVLLDFRSALPEIEKPGEFLVLKCGAHVNSRCRNAEVVSCMFPERVQGGESLG